MPRGRSIMRPDDSAERYRSLEKVGEGAFGVVTRAIERETGREVALKRVRVPDLSTLPIPALREMLALRRVEHPHVVPLLSRYTHGANIVLVFPFLPGSLAGLLAAQSAPLPQPEAAAHEVGHVHQPRGQPTRGHLGGRAQQLQHRGPAGSREAALQGARGGGEPNEGRHEEAPCSAAERGVHHMLGPWAAKQRSCAPARLSHPPGTLQ